MKIDTNKNMIKALIIGLISLIVIIGAWSVERTVSVRNKHRIESDTIYQKKFRNVIQAIRHNSGFEVGPCVQTDVDFVLTRDSVFISNSGKPALKYIIQGLRGDGGLVCLRPDSAQVIFYKLKDKRDTIKRVVVMEQEHISILFFESTECPETAK